MTHSRRSSWAAFFSRQRTNLVRYVRTLIVDAADRDSEDIVQDVMVGLFGKADIGAPIENLSAYVYQALRNKVVDRLRRRKNDTELDAPVSEESGETLVELLADLRYETSQESERASVRSDLYRVIDALEDDSREIVIATEVHGTPFAALSEEWGEPIGTLLARKSRAMKKLREALLACDPDYYSRLDTRKEFV